MLPIIILTSALIANLIWGLYERAENAKKANSENQITFK